MSDWYYSKDNQQQGPVNEAEIKEMLANGKLNSSTLVWRDGLENWTTAGSIPEFQFRPPPLPSAPKAATPPPLAEPEPVEEPAPAEEAASTEEEPVVFDENDVTENKAVALIAYLSILFLVPMIVAKESPFAKYHANQGLVLFLATLVVGVGIGIIGAIPFVNLSLIILWPLYSLAWLALTVLGIMNAAKGEAKPLPFIGQYKILT